MDGLVSRAGGGIELLGVPIARLESVQALERVERLHDAGPPATVVYANANTLNLAAADGGFRRLLRRADLVLNDGSGVALAGRLHGLPFPANLNGTDFNLQILELAAHRSWPVYLLGARDGVAAAAGERLGSQLPGLRVVGTRHGYVGRAGDHAAVRAEIRASGASLLFVAMGQPLQERWLHANLAGTGCRLGVAVGGFLDFAAGIVPRAPEWMREAGVEWAFRLGQEPGRLWRRYVLGNPAFVCRVVHERVVLGRGARTARPHVDALRAGL
jgi:N-acetylglucosaminyldiphosphoundecaprenol N-acetyl-beta-D-mannosaminyltransferase